MRLQIVRTISGAVLAIVAAAFCGATADIYRGEQFAEKWCAVCHALKPNQASSDLSAPPFAAVAADPTANAAALRGFINTTPHKSMPKFKLQTRDMDDVIDYILSLRR